MSNSKMTRRALITSMMALMLCFAMLTGTTFAWFTDQETSGNNQIIAGNLDVEMYNALTVDDAAIIEENTKLFDGVKYWEPGVVSYENITIANNGNLALKYQLSVNFEDNGLADALKVGVIDGGIADGTSRDGVKAAVATWMPIKSFVELGELLADDNDATTTEKTTETYGIVIYWEPSDNDNQFNGNDKNATKEFSVNFGVKLIATQLAAEYDAFDNQYDANAGDYYSAVYNFDSEDDLLAFAPTAGNAASSGLSITPDGKAQVDASGAWKTLDVNLADSEYTMSYALDITSLASGESLTVDTGDSTTWGSTPIMLERGSTKVYYGTAKNEYIGTLEGTIVTLTHTYSYVGDNKLVITTVISDGVNTLTCSKEVNSAAETTLYWDIYSVTESGKATLDSFSVNETEATIDSVTELALAIENAKDGDTVFFGGNITSEDGILIENKNIVIDLNGYTFSVSEGVSTSSRAFKIIGSSVVTVKNGTIIADGDTDSGAYGTIRTEGSANVTLENLKLYNYRGGGLNVKVVTGTNVTINNCEIYSQYGGGVEASGGNIVLNNVKIDQKGVYDNGWYSVAMEINSSGKIIVNSGEYFGGAISTDANATKGNCVAFILSSGGTLDINGGTFTGVVAESAAAANFCGLIYADRAAVVNIYGGTFNSNGAILDMRNNAGTQPNPKATIYGGTYSADPTVSGLYSSNLIKLADGCEATQNADGAWVVNYDGAIVNTAEKLTAALAEGKNILLTADISYDAAVNLAENVVFDGNGKTVSYTVDDDYHLVKLNTGAEIKNVTFENYRVRTESTTNGTVTMSNVVINMDNDLTGLDISRGAGTAKLTKVTCKGITDATHLDPTTQVQVDYTPYGDVLLGGAWALEADGCKFGSLHGWNTKNGSNVSLKDTTCTVFRMHYWSGRTLYVNGVETAWSESGAIPVAHDVGGCWSVQPAFK